MYLNPPDDSDQLILQDKCSYERKCLWYHMPECKIDIFAVISRLFYNLQATNTRVRYHVYHVAKWNLEL